MKITETNFLKKIIIRPFLFFFCLVSSDWSRFSRFQNKLRRRQWHIFSNKCHLNLKHKSKFSLFAFYFDNVDFFLLQCHVDFVTTPRCFQAPRICWGTGPPTSRLLFEYFVFFSFPSDRPKIRKRIRQKTLFFLFCRQQFIFFLYYILLTILK